MYQRKESTKRMILKDGTAINVRILDGLMIEDLVSQHMEAYLFGLSNGTYTPPNIGRDIKDHLIRLYTIL